jgi:hypothetical protein
MSGRLLRLLFLGFLAAAPANAALSPGSAIPVRILYDNSGSMYPGYRPPGSPDRRSHHQLGTHFYHQSPAFAEWLDDFVQRQPLVDAGTVGMWTFTSNDRFAASDIQEVQPAVPVHDFHARQALANFPANAGNSTYLTEALGAFSEDFTGLVWLITDNIVETKAGEADAGVQQFFATVARERKFRSVHLFKYPFQENGQSGALAVYGILVSTSELQPSTLAYYDAKFRALREAKRREGSPPADLFPGREYLKLKDLRIEPLRPDLRLVLGDGDSGTFREGRSIQLQVDGVIRSYLTQHSVTGGKYEIRINTAFQPDAWAARNLGAQPLAPEVFDSSGGDISEPIPPGGARPVRASLRSTQPVSFSPRGVSEWLRLAWNGASVPYTGTIRLALTDVRIRLEPQRMSGIFGIDHASTIFDFQNVTALPRVAPSVVTVSFALKTGSRRTAILLVVVIALIAALSLAGLLLARTRTFRISLSNAPDTVAALRPLRSHPIAVDGLLLGRLSRGLTNRHLFWPVTAAKQFTIVPAGEPDTWEVRFAGGSIRRLSIKADGQRLRTARTSVPGSRASPPAAPSPKTAPPPPNRPPRIGQR